VEVPVWIDQSLNGFRMEFKFIWTTFESVSWCSCVTTWSKPLSPQGYHEGGRMKWPKAMAGPVYLWSPKLLPSVGACFDLMRTCERLPTWTTWDVWSGTLRGSSVKSVWRVDWVFPCKVYIDSNHRDSQIWVPLVCGSHHVDNLIAWIMAYCKIVMLHYNYLFATLAWLV
jgi:hypothetical protein